VGGATRCRSQQCLNRNPMQVERQRWCWGFAGRRFRHHPTWSCSELHREAHPGNFGEHNWGDFGERDHLLTLIAVHPRRGAQPLNDIGVLAGYTGTVVHDGYASYDLFGLATHAQCGAHLLRHVKAVSQAEAFAVWAAQMTGVLMEAKAASEAAAEAGLPAVGPALAEGIRRRYNASLDIAFGLLPPGPKPRRRHTGVWSDAERKAWDLATRLREDAGQVLRLLDDTRVPFTDNAAEKALRMVKLHDKISGPFHSLAAAEAFAAVRSLSANSGQPQAEPPRRHAPAVYHWRMVPGPAVPG
jgi:hypothetical protein